MLAALNAHSRAMFGFDGPDEAESSTQAQARLSRSVSGSQAGSDDDQDGDGGDFESDDGWGEGDDMVTDSEDELEPVVETKVVKPAKVPEVVFAPTQTSSSVMLSKSERRAFLVSRPRTESRASAYTNGVEWLVDQDDGYQAGSGFYTQTGEATARGRQ